MRICLILEGCYPYVRGGVSSWAHNYIRAMPEHEFVLWTVDAQSERQGKFKYELPSNVVEVREVFLDNASPSQAKRGKIRLSSGEIGALLQLTQCSDPDWPLLFSCYNTKKTSPVAFLKSEQYLDLLKRMCAEKYPFAAFSDLFFSVRSMILPLLFLMTQDIPRADMYHSVATGYSGILGVMGAWRYGSPYVVTEHGIYTREREEEILRSNWIIAGFKDMWIAFFNMLSRCAYNTAHSVTSLYGHAMKTQISLGCQPEKCRVINNGVNSEYFADIQPKKQDGFVDIGAVVRIAPIKDIKTMIYSFVELKHSVPRARLHILGDVDDEEYSSECHALVNQLGVDDLWFLGNVDVHEYIKKLDFTILTSISEGQPLAVIEAMAAGRAVVATDVGSCRELLEGASGDKLGHCGICTPPMHPQALSDSMRRLCNDPELSGKMGETGRKRVQQSYTHDRMIKQYRAVYEELAGQWPALGSN